MVRAGHQSQGRLLDFQGSPSERPLDTVGSSSEEEVGALGGQVPPWSFFSPHGALILGHIGCLWVHPVCPWVSQTSEATEKPQGRQEGCGTDVT